MKGDSGGHFEARIRLGVQVHDAVFARQHAELLYAAGDGAVLGLPDEHVGLGGAEEDFTVL